MNSANICVVYTKEYIPILLSNALEVLLNVTNSCWLREFGFSRPSLLPNGGTKIVLSVKVSSKMFLTKLKLFSVPIDYMQYLLEYLYTAQCSIPVSELDDVSRYASQLKMHDFVDLLNHEFSVFTEWSKLKVSYSYISLRLTHF